MSLAQQGPFKSDFDKTEVAAVARWGLSQWLEHGNSLVSDCWTPSTFESRLSYFELL